MQFDPPTNAASTSAFGSVSRTLLTRAQAHDPSAHDHLIEIYGPLVYRWCRRSLQPSDAADAVQEVFLAVFRSIHNFRYDRPNATFRGWLRIIARNKVRDSLRKQERLPIAEGGTDQHVRLHEVAAPEAEEELLDETMSEQDERRVLLRGGLEVARQDVQQHTWQAFWLTTIDQRDAKDVTTQLGMKPGAVRHAKMRVLRRLRELLGDDFPDSGSPDSGSPDSDRSPG